MGGSFQKTFAVLCGALSALALLAFNSQAHAQTLTNPNFSDNVNPGLSLTTFEGPTGFFSYQFDQSNVPGWSTTAGDGRIEIWEFGHLNVPSQSGAHFAEINATSSGAELYQDVTFAPGQTLVYSIWHRGRDGTDVADIRIGAPGSLVLQQTMTTGNTDWMNYTGLYVVPAGVTTVRFAFRSVSSASSNGAAGNFIDNLTFTLVNPSLSIAKVADDDTLRSAGDVINYTYTVTNDGNVSINNVAVNDTHNGSGPAPTPGNETIVTDSPPTGDSTDNTSNDGVWSSLGPGDTIRFVGTYTVTQTDVDQLQ